MDIRSFLKGMRLGNHPSSEEFDEFIKGVTNDSVSSAQIAAFTMATCIHGLDESRRLTLTAAMRDSGETMSWDLPGPILDKHSTGGILQRAAHLFRWFRDAALDTQAERWIAFAQFRVLASIWTRRTSEGSSKMLVVQS